MGTVTVIKSSNFAWMFNKEAKYNLVYNMYDAIVTFLSCAFTMHLQ